MLQTGMTTYFHATGTSRVQKILQEGLVIGKRRQWRNPMGGMLGDRTKIYVFSDYYVAIRFAARFEYYAERPASIVKLNLDGITVEPDPDLEARMEAGTWWMCSTPIPPNLIDAVFPLTLEMKREVVSAVRRGMA